ncbi:hypothetical protein EBQ26_00330 [Allofranklinella schreckenbergeri]|uniref:Uncharacterized protein n=1 Tax=Allofranklinella schreckenbergeri TaxID=1076744 RepID=A0A3M6QF33_9BURK|nr:hypothetical protein EBQ26_00330 [Allofranklinella schreckenbergeri]
MISSHRQRIDGDAKSLGRIGVASAIGLLIGQAAPGKWGKTARLDGFHGVAPLLIQRVRFVTRQGIVGAMPWHLALALSKHDRLRECAYPSGNFDAGKPKKDQFS